MVAVRSEAGAEGLTLSPLAYNHAETRLPNGLRVERRLIAESAPICWYAPGEGDDWRATGARSSTRSGRFGHQHRSPVPKRERQGSLGLPSRPRFSPEGLPARGPYPGGPRAGRAAGRSVRPAKRRASSVPYTRGRGPRPVTWWSSADSSGLGDGMFTGSSVKSATGMGTSGGQPGVGDL